MALEEEALKKFNSELLRASIELNSRKLLFKSEWVFEMPSQDLQIKNMSLIEKYDIPVGWNGYGSKDLEKLEKEGFLRKIFESEEDPLTLEKIIKYEIKN